MSIWRDILTGKDGQTHDLGRWSWVVSIAAVVGHSVVLAMRGLAVDLQALATALGLVTAAHGGALWAKKDTEPDPTPSDPAKGPPC